MMRAIVKSIAVTGLASSLLLADFSYEQTSKITGGMMAGVLKMAGALSKQAREPLHSTVAVKGDRMWHGSEMHGSIIDLSKETITTIDFQKKTWSVMTFAEMNQMLQQMSQRMKENQQADMHFKVSASATGQTRQISGMEAKEMLVKMEMEGTDQQSGQTGSMVITSNIWIAPKAPGYEEVRDFQRRMAEKLHWTPDAGAFGMGRPEVAKGMAEVVKEGAKLDGMPVLTLTKMGAEGQPPAQNQAQGQAPAQPPQQQTDAPPPTSPSSAIGSALAGRFGLGRKKKNADSDQGNSAQGGSAGAPDSGSLMEMSTEASNFSSAPVDAGRFEVPAGFKQVESPMRRMQH